MVNTEDIESAIQEAFMLWGLSSPDIVEIYHSLRIIRIKQDKPVPTWDDFSVAYGVYKGK